MSKEILKKWLKLIKEFEETASMAIGLIVVILLSGTVFIVIAKFSHLFSPDQNVGVKNDIEIHENINSIVSPVEQNASTFFVQEKQSLETHVVESGEGLWQIAEKYYGDGNKYLQIYEANKDKMKNSEDIRIGMELKIPEK